jgi:hypothetical protein
MDTLRLAIPAVFALVVAIGGAPAEGLLPPAESIETVVDHYINDRLAREHVPAAAEADDATLVRRLTLDLVGRIPTPSETRDYLKSTDKNKRATLVDRLMASPGFIRHQTDCFEAMLMAGSRGELRDYLARAFGENRPWDGVFRELMAGDESAPARKGSAGFLKSRAKDLDRLTSDVSSVFFGVDVSCAKCHDHPKVKDWKQDHYYGMKSFLGRTFESNGFVGENDYGLVKFKPIHGDERRAKFMFLTGRVVEVAGGDEPSKEARQEEKRRLDEAKKKKSQPPAPKVSARAKLVEVALEPGERDFFARSIVNRLWSRFYGTGLVMPLDQMHSANPPSHPELLAWLARDTIEHKYDLRRLIRGLVLSRAYARSSRWESAEAPDARLFAVAAVRPLTPLQLAASMWVATTDVPEKDQVKSVESLAERGRSLASTIARPGDDYQIGAAEALLMSNGDRIKDLLADGGDRLVGRMAKLGDRRARVDLAVQAVLSRPPDEEERTLLSDFLAGHDRDAIEGCRELVWALLTDAEFRFNY